MDNNIENENNSEIKEEAAHSEGYNTVHTKTFAQRNKYRIRQICGVIALVALVGGSVVLLTKCSGNDISDADSKLTVVKQTSESSLGESSGSDTSSSESDSSSQSETSSQTTQTPSETSETTSETSDTTQQTSESSEQTTQTTSAQTTTQSTTSKQTTKATTTPSTTSKQTATQPVGPANVEKRNGITYVNGILIANKTYALPSTYVPELVPVGGYQYLEPNAAAAFKKMQQAAAAEGINIYVCSGYRSYSYQQQLYNNYAAYDGIAGADRYSARAGYSEHQTGLAADVNMASSYFDNTPEAKWLAKHCTDYGFIIRYKAGKESSTGYMAESWHVRYLGDVQLCKKIEASGLSLEEYLGITSKYAN